MQSSGFIQKEIEIWTYLQEGGFKLVFVDIEEFGGYTLIYSTSDNEASHPSWEKYMNLDILH